MKIIKLTQNKKTKIDDIDFEWVSKTKWQYKRNGRWPGYVTARGGRILHREITKCPPHKEVDHINRDTLDNRRSNLRIATIGQNAFNRGKPRGFHYSKYKGVTLDKRRKVWLAQLKTKGKNYNLGRFNTEKEAALAYDGFAKIKFGEFSRLNFN